MKFDSPRRTEQHAVEDLHLRATRMSPKERHGDTMSRPAPAPAIARNTQERVAMDPDKTVLPSLDEPDSRSGATRAHLWTKNKKANRKSARVFVPNTLESAQVKGKLENRAYAKRYAELQHDVRDMTLTKLYAKYRGEYNSWRRAHNPNDRQKGISFDYVAFGDFRNWLVHLGRRPFREYTADRISLLKGYEPGNLRWASKQEQAENRKTTRRVEWAGSRYTRREFAGFLGIQYKRLCKQLERGWSLSRIVAAAGRTLDPVEGFSFGNETLEREYWNRPEAYFTTKRLDWLPQFFEAQANAAKRPDVQAKFRELARDAERERQRRYAERDVVQTAKQVELLEQVAPLYPMFNPLPSVSAPSVAQGPCNDCGDVKPSKPEESAGRLRKVARQSDQERERQRQAIIHFMSRHEKSSEVVLPRNI